MRQVSFTSLIQQSLRRTELILLKPFSLKKCLKLLWIALLAGVLSSGSCNINLPSSPSGNKSTKASTSQTTAVSPKAQATSFDFETRIQQLKPSTWGIIVFVGVLFFGWLIVFFSWLNARFEFVWWEAMVTNTTAIRDPLMRYREQGYSLFKFKLAMVALFLVFFGVIAWTIYWMFTNGSIKLDATHNWAALVSTGITFFLLFILFLIIAAIFTFIVYPQIVTLMALDHCRFSKAWARFWDIYSAHQKDFWLFMWVSFGMSIVAGILTAIVGIVVVIILLLIGLIIGGPIAFLLWKSQLILWTVAIILGIPYILVFMVALMLLCLPVAVFFRSFSLYFLSSLNCGYEPLPLTKESIEGVL